ncbi:MAG: hypothetical protein AAGJ31_06555, partial [Verrucomicrobiota bacterium]
MNEARLGDGLRGAALLITLAFVSGTAVVVIAMLSMSRQQVRHSTLTSHGERSRLGVTQQSIGSDRSQDLDLAASGSGTVCKMHVGWGTRGLKT